jgi:uncharacterized protein (TIGR00369 family)
LNVDRARSSFGRQGFMRTLGARMTHAEEGAVEIELPYDERLTQQHGFVHAGALAAILDSACGYAALTTMEEGRAVLTVEFKLNLIRPATGDAIVARARVVRAGRTLTVCAGDAFARTGDGETHVATMLATMIAADPPDGRTD